MYFWKVCGVLLYVTKTFTFPSIPQSIRLPIWSSLHIPPTISAFLCVLCMPRSPTIIHFLYFIYWGRWSWNTVCLPISLVYLSAVTQKHPLSWQQSSHHTGQLTSCVTAWCWGQVNKLSIQSQFTHIYPARSQITDNWTGNDTSILPRNDEIFFIPFGDRIKCFGSLIHCHILIIGKHFYYLPNNIFPCVSPLIAPPFICSLFAGIHAVIILMITLSCGPTSQQTLQ